MSLYGMFQGKGASGFGYNSTTDEVTEGLNLSGKTYLVTGCNSGLGLDTLRVLASRGAVVIGAARTLEKATAACEQVSKTAIPVAAELSEPDSVRQAVKQVGDSCPPLDGIIANAGIMALPKRAVKHGLEMQFLTNHIGHFILVTGLLPRLTELGRVVMLSSTGHTLSWSEGIRLDDLSAEKRYTPLKNYGQSKLANLLFAKHLATLLTTGQSANSVHPGVITTNLARHLHPVLQSLFQSLGPYVATKSIPQGAATQAYVATHPDAAEITGEYFADCNVTRANRHGRDADLAERLWVKSEEIVAAL